MAPITSSLLSFLLVIPLLASTASFTYPRYIADLPRDATHLALDEKLREIIAFSGNGTKLSRFAFDSSNSALVERQTTGSCATMSSSDVQTLSGWNTLKSTAEGRTYVPHIIYKLFPVVLNVDHGQYPNQLAHSCVSTDTVSITPIGDPSAALGCTSQTSTSSGQQVGTSGTIALTHSVGTTSSTTTTITSSDNFHRRGVSVEAKVDFPGIGDVKSRFSLTDTFTNTLSTACVVFPFLFQCARDSHVPSSVHNSNLQYKWNGPDPHARNWG
ncbi:hypothetical protein C8R44DRAFT_885626 [Mycena epipterygia]|nr:hypothetical protein C8R44DRAFT_885626 [Mycena epipterygia]